MLLETFAAVRDLGRLHEIASILLRYGFGELVARLGIRSALLRAGRTLRGSSGPETARLDLPERIRCALEEMGPTFIKLGQILATRVDLFTPNWIREFEKLQHHVPGVPYADVKERFEHDLGQPLFDVFAEFDEEPIAAASIAQVHKARLRDGSLVVVKIRRPGIRRTVEADLRLLELLARLAEYEFPELERYRPREIVRQFKVALSRELDFVVESRHCARMASHFVDDPNVLIPKIYWDYVGERYLVQDFIDGVPGLDAEGIVRAGLDRKALARVGAEAVLRMVLVHGFFHADPHPGNLIYLPGNRLAFIDFGMMGRLTESRRNQLVDLLAGMAEKDAKRAADVLMEWASVSYMDSDALVSDVDAFIGNYHGMSVRHMNLTSILNDLTELMRQHQLMLPPDLILLFKTLITLDGMARQNDPDFDIFGQVGPFLREALLSRYQPATVVRRGWQNLAQVIDLLGAMPAELRRILRAVQSGNLQLNIDLARLDHLGWQMDRTFSRLTLGLVTAAMIIASSTVLPMQQGPQWFGLSAFGVGGSVLGGVGLVWLMFSIWRSLRRRGRR